MFAFFSQKRKFPESEPMDTTEADDEVNNNNHLLGIFNDLPNEILLKILGHVASITTLMTLLSASDGDPRLRSLVLAAKLDSIPARETFVYCKRTLRRHLDIRLKAVEVTGVTSSTLSIALNELAALCPNVADLTLSGGLTVTPWDLGVAARAFAKLKIIRLKEVALSSFFRPQNYGKCLLAHPSSFIKHDQLYLKEVHLIRVKGVNANKMGLLNGVVHGNPAFKRFSLTEDTLEEVEATRRDIDNLNLEDSQTSVHWKTKAIVVTKHESIMQIPAKQFFVTEKR